jgi:hypothetical protein
VHDHANHAPHSALSSKKAPSDLFGAVISSYVPPQPGLVAYLAPLVERYDAIVLSFAESPRIWQTASRFIMAGDQSVLDQRTRISSESRLLIALPL